MLDPKTLTAFDETTALGIATLWNDAMPTIRQYLDRQIHDIETAGRLITECDDATCDTHDKHRQDDEDCPCWVCENSGLPTMATDLRHWLDSLHTDGTAYGVEPTPESLLDLVTTWFYVNGQVSHTNVPAYQLGPLYRLAAELADQTNAKFTAMAADMP